MEWGVGDTLAVIGLIGGAVAFIVGLAQHRRNQQWKRAEWVAQEMKAFLADPQVQNALYMIDWGQRPIQLFPHRKEYEEQFVVVTSDDIHRALQAHEQRGPFTNVEVAIRDSFDRFLEGLERFESYVVTGLVEPSDLAPYLAYWCFHIATASETPTKSKRLNQLKGYMQRYGFAGAHRLIERVYPHYVKGQISAHGDNAAELPVAPGPAQR